MNFRLLICASFFVILMMGCQAAGEDGPTGTSSLTAEPAGVTDTSVPPTAPPAADEPDFAVSRQQMVDQQIVPRNIDNEAVIDAMRNVPRHKFVPEDVRELAYADHPLPIGYGQTISQPYIVALMTQSLEPYPGQKVLEIGTGSGYQAAVLAELGIDVYTVEIIPELAERSAGALDTAGYTQVKKLNADGYFGWEENAPYDAIIVTAAPDHLPLPLVEQLQEGGRIVIPIGPVGFVQTLWQFEKIEGEMQATNLGGVTFVPLTGEH